MKCKCNPQLSSFQLTEKCQELKITLYLDLPHIPTGLIHRKKKKKPLLPTIYIQGKYTSLLAFICLAWGRVGEMGEPTSSYWELWIATKSYFFQKGLLVQISLAVLQDFTTCCKVCKSPAREELWGNSFGKQKNTPLPTITVQ